MSTTAEVWRCNLQDIPLDIFWVNRTIVDDVGGVGSTREALDIFESVRGDTAYNENLPANIFFVRVPLRISVGAAV